MPRKLTNTEFINKANIKHNNKFNYSLSDYQCSLKKVVIICPVHGEFSQLAKEHLKGVGCQKCSISKNLLAMQSKKRFTKEQFVTLSNLKHNGKYDYSLTVYKNNKTNVTIICPTHGEFVQAPSNHMGGNGCKYCAWGELNYSKEEFVEKANKQHENKFDYSLVNFNIGSDKVQIICQKHGIFEQKVYNHLMGNGCPTCKSSKGERTIRKILTEKNIIFEAQKQFPTLKDKRHLKFDFYLPEHNICIEYDGEQHFKKTMYFGSERKFKDVKTKDKIKTEFCINNKINLIRIGYTQNISDALSSIHL